jgi:hypothetical protein
VEQGEEAQEDGVDEVEGDKVQKEVDKVPEEEVDKVPEEEVHKGDWRKNLALLKIDNHEQQLVVSKLIVINLIVDLVICYITSNCIHTTSFLHRL